MSINFDALAKSAGSTTIPEGHYIGTIKKAEMKQPKDDTKKPYLNITWGLKTEDNKDAGTFFDIFTESESSIQQFKLRSFIEALQINLKEFELKDLTKIVPGRVCRLKIVVKDEKSSIDVFSNECYEPFTPDVEDDKVPFDPTAPEQVSDSNY